MGAANWTLALPYLMHGVYHVIVMPEGYYSLPIEARKLLHSRITIIEKCKLDVILSTATTSLYT